MVSLFLSDINNFQTSIWLIDETLTGTIIWGQIGPERNGNKGILHTSQSPKTATSPSDTVYKTRLIAFHIVLIPLGKSMNPIILPPAMGK